MGVVPKTYLPTYREFYERRWYASGPTFDGVIRFGGTLDQGGIEVMFGTNLLFRSTDVPGLVLHVEICEDVWVPVPPSSRAALAGATVLVNLSGSPITIARADDRRTLVQSQSLRCLAAYVYAAAGQGESTNDVSWDGQTMIYEAGTLLAETERFPDGPRMSIADVDLDRLRQDRLRQGTFDDNRVKELAPASVPGDDFIEYEFTLDPPATDIGLRRPLDRFPFVPDDPSRLAQDCYEAFNIQVDALMRRIQSTGAKSLVIGISGGLDSTHALIVAAKACDRLGLPRSFIRGYTMPGFGTSDHTKSNAQRLMEVMEITAGEIDIRPAAQRMLADIGHAFADGEPVHDVTFENVQAGLRTDYLFRLAGQHGGFVLGTGDLSELALGWCTYGVGDQMSHYGINAGVPKTLIQYLIRWVIATGQFTEVCGQVLEAILNTEISPELVPPGADGAMQSTQSIVGPYELNDFYLHHIIRYGQSPSKVAFLAWHAWKARGQGLWPAGFPEGEKREYDLGTIAHWLDKFCARFFGFSQFKRSAMPNGPKVSSAGALSPRGDWRAPSDAVASVWREELRSGLPPEVATTLPDLS